MTPYILAVDLGQTNDYTAIIGLRRADAGVLECIGIERLPLGMSYPDQVEHIADLTRRADLSGRCMVAVDATGVGAAVVDLLRPKVDPAPFYAVTITSGNTVTKDGRKWRVPKRDLIGTAQVALQQRRVRLPRASVEAEVLVEELQAYRVTIAANGHDTYGNDWREAPHDDLVFALALAIYVADATAGRQATIEVATGRIPLAESQFMDGRRDTRLAAAPPSSSIRAMSRALTRSEIAALAADLRAMLEKIEAGELDATPAMRHRIEGALAVLDVVQGRAARFAPEAD